MFTGLVEEIGAVREALGGHLVIEATLVLEDSSVGDSICVNGCCLTVTELGTGCFSTLAVDETLARTNLGALLPGDGVNLERALRADGRFGGHIVQGHIDGTGEVTATEPFFEVKLGDNLMPYVAEKGSIAIDGVSLTVASLDISSRTVGIALIGHTRSATVLGRRRVGERVNLEMDILAKYLERFAGRPSGIE